MFLPMPNEFLSWWLQQMLDLVPKRLSALGEERASAVVVTSCGAPGARPIEIELADRKARQERPLGRFALDAEGIRAVQRAAGARPRRKVVLRLPADMLLERSVALPLATEREPERVLRYEMDRLTPFTAEEVFWSWSIERRDRQRGRLHLRFSLVPKAGLAPVVAGLQQAGLPPDVLELRLPGGDRRLIAVAQPHSRSQRWRRRALVTASALCGTLAAAAIVLPFAQQSLARQVVEDRIEVLQPKVAEAEALRAKLSRDRAGSDVLTQDQARLGDALQAIAELTQVLPDDTYLTELTLQERKLVLTGQSLAAAKLIAALSADPLIRNPAFAASVTRAEGSNADLFSIRAELGD
jgi:general secretion pathway protein L